MHRYVVLHHTGHGPAHFDLMIEASDGKALLTWRVPVWPLAEGQPLTALGEHRRAYLDFEGPVTGGRGEVRRVATGTCHHRLDEDGEMVVQFDDDPAAWRLGKTARRAPTYDQHK